jgi:C4-dicarboxylate transporter
MLNVVIACVYDTKQIMKRLLLKNKLTLIGVVLGAVGGFAYWYYVGCASGTCMITSKPLNSSAYGALMGGLFFSIFQTEKKNNKKG